MLLQLTVAVLCVGGATPTVTMTPTLSESGTLPTPTRTEGVSYTYPHPEMDVAVTVQGRVLEGLGDRKYAVGGWRAKVAELMHVAADRVIVYWEGDQVLRVAFGGGCDPCCGCTPVDQRVEHNGLTAEELHLEFITKIACCPSTCRGYPDEIDPIFCAPLGITEVLYVDMACGALTARGLCGLKEGCSWGGDVCEAPTPSPTPSPTAEDDDDIAVLWLVLIPLLACAVLGCVAWVIYWYCSRSKKVEPRNIPLRRPPPPPPPGPVSMNDPHPEQHFYPTLVPIPPPPPKSIFRKWEDASWA